jgi:hypothetical protein
MKVLLVVLAILMVATMSYAVEPKVSYFYEVDNSEFVKLIGTSVKEDVNGIKGLDIDAWYEIEGMELKYDEVTLNNLIMSGISYSKEVKGFDVGINIAVGQDRIEKLDVDMLGETKYGIGICIGKKF